MLFSHIETAMTKYSLQAYIIILLLAQNFLVSLLLNVFFYSLL